MLFRFWVMGVESEDKEEGEEEEEDEQNSLS